MNEERKIFDIANETYQAEVEFRARKSYLLSTLRKQYDPENKVPYNMMHKLAVGIIRYIESTHRKNYNPKNKLIMKFNSGYCEDAEEVINIITNIPFVKPYDKISLVPENKNVNRAFRIYIDFGEEKKS